MTIDGLFTQEVGRYILEGYTIMLDSSKGDCSTRLQVDMGKGESLIRIIVRKYAGSHTMEVREFKGDFKNNIVWDGECEKLEQTQVKNGEVYTTLWKK